MEIILDPNKRYSYADYLTWMDDAMRELFNGVVRKMSPAPSLKHAILSTKILGRVLNFIDGSKGKCMVFHAPFDVRLPKGSKASNDEIFTVVQPDICVVCDLSKLDERGCLGAPDLIVEVQSPATAKYDLNDKFKLYEESGVHEYWVAFPEAKAITSFLLQGDGKYDKGTTYELDGKIPVHIFDGMEIDMKDLFD